MDLTSATTAYRFIKSGGSSGVAVGVTNAIPQNYQEMLTKLFGHHHHHHHSPLTSPSTAPDASFPNSPTSSTSPSFSASPSPFSRLSSENLMCLLNYFHSSTRWEDHAFHLLLSIHLLKSSHYIDLLSDLIHHQLHPNMRGYLTHEEPRVRQITCQLIGILVQDHGYVEYQFLVEVIISCVQENRERECQTRPVILGEEKELALDEVTGWKSLETSYNAFKELVRGLRHFILLKNSQLSTEREGVPAPANSPTAAEPPEVALWRRSRVAPIGPDALQLFIIDAGVHMNRYVRQSCCELIEIMCQTPSPIAHHPHPHVAGEFNRIPSSLFTEPPSLQMVVAIRNVLAIGLQDSWCQVRLAATMATKSFLGSLSNDLTTERQVWPLILPRLCLNRHYSTDSVKEIAQATWIQRLGSRGRELLSEFMSDVVPYYVSMTRHKNHIVCEAACASIAELVSRIPSPAVDSYLSLMLVALRDSLVDASWPVRDRACIAIGRYIRSIWNRNLDLQSAADIRLIPIPTTEMILHYDPQLGSGEGKEEEVAQEDQERLPVIKIIQESVEILLSYLHTDPFRPVRESAAIAIVDCVLPPAAPLAATTENPLKAQFQDHVWKKIENYLQSYLLAAATTSHETTSLFAPPPSVKSSSNVSTSASTSTRSVNKAIRFLPDSVVSELMSGSTVTVRNTNDTNSEFKPLISSSSSSLSPQGGMAGDTLSWGGSVKGKLKRSKPRVGGGWGCCLDCAAGENRPLYPWEESETAILLLRELIGTLPQTNPESERRIRDFLQSQVQNMWLLLNESNQRDIHRLHTAIYQILPSLMEGLDKASYEREISDHIAIFLRDLNPSEEPINPPQRPPASPQPLLPTPPTPQDEERNRLRAIKDLQKKAISSQAYCFSPLKKCATLECCEKMELIIGRNYFEAMTKASPAT